MAVAHDRSDQDDSELVEFGPFRLDRARRLLTKDGIPVPLGDRAIKILLMLVGQAPEVVSKATLFEQAWPGTFIEESTLRYQLWTLRKALKDGEGRSYISTASGRGYRFVGPLTAAVVATEESPGSPKTDAAKDTNLPLRLTAIIGRQRELAEVADQLKHSRLVTLAGPGGVGKTSLAVELGWRLLGEFAAGAWLIDLAPLVDRDAAASAVAAALGVSVAKTEATVELIVAALGKARRLLIFDNCDHLTEVVAPLIRTLLERAPGLTILATSLRNLSLAAEHVYALDPLAVPPAGAVEIGRYSAVELFARRARAADRLFELSKDNSADVGEICRQLDGLPLALEMAAGRLRLLGIEGLRRGLDDRLKLLKGASTGGTRYASLYGMLEWSHSLLAPFDQKIFRRLAIFPGSFTLDAAIAVASEDEAERWAVVDALGRLIDQSLLTIERREPLRYRLLETLRLYATEKLRECGETDAVAERHARYFTGVFNQGEACWEEMPDVDWIARYQPELGHLRAALDWALAVPERRQIAIALAASGFLLVRWLELLGEGLRYLDRILPLLDAGTPPVIAARLLHLASLFCVFTDDPRGPAFAERSAALCRECGDRVILANALATLAQFRAWKDQYAEAQGFLQEARDLLAGSTLKKSRLRLTAITGGLALKSQDVATAKRCHLEALELARALKSSYEISLLNDLSVCEEALGNIDGAIELTRLALSRSRSQPGGSREGVLLTNLGSYLVVKGDIGGARPVLEEAFSVLVELGNYSSEHCLRQWAALAAFEGCLAEAARLIGFTDMERNRNGRSLSYLELPLHNRLLAILEAALSSTELDVLRAEGARWSEAEAIEFVSSRLMQCSRLPAKRI